MSETSPYHTRGQNGQHSSAAPKQQFLLGTRLKGRKDALRLGNSARVNFHSCFCSHWQATQVGLSAAMASIHSIIVFVSFYVTLTCAQFNLNSKTNNVVYWVRYSFQRLVGALG